MRRGYPLNKMVRAGLGKRSGITVTNDGNQCRSLLCRYSRSFMDYNTSHIRCAVNVANSKIGKRRLQHERVSVRDLLVNNCDADSYSWAVVYDTNTRTVGQIASDSFQAILLEKLTAIFPRVSFLNGAYVLEPRELTASQRNLVHTQPYTRFRSIQRFVSPFFRLGRHRRLQRVPDPLSDPD